MNYPGGKGAVYHKLVNLMPPHEVYIETHLGGGAVMRNKRPANRNIGVEIDPEVRRMWGDGNQIGFEMIQGDAANYLKSYRFTGKELVYCDPPYLSQIIFSSCATVYGLAVHFQGQQNLKIFVQFQGRCLKPFPLALPCFLCASPPKGVSI